MEVTISYVDIGPLFLPVLLILMVLKFVTVVSYFMHLKFDNKIFSFMFYVGLVLAVFVYCAALATFHFFGRNHCPSECFRSSECFAGASPPRNTRMSLTGQTCCSDGSVRLPGPSGRLDPRRRLTLSYVYMVKAVGPHAVVAGQPVVTRATCSPSPGRW